LSKEGSNVVDDLLADIACFAIISLNNTSFLGLLAKAELSANIKGFGFFLDPGNDDWNVLVN